MSRNENYDPELKKKRKNSLRNFEQSYSGWNILVLWHPVCKNIVRRRPTEIFDSWDLEALLIQQTERLRIESMDKLKFQNNNNNI